jgi:hypothetical protein
VEEFIDLTYAECHRPAETCPVEGSQSEEINMLTFFSPI